MANNLITLATTQRVLTAKNAKEAKIILMFLI